MWGPANWLRVRDDTSVLLSAPEEATSVVNAVIIAGRLAGPTGMSPWWKEKLGEAATLNACRRPPPAPRCGIDGGDSTNMSADGGRE